MREFPVALIASPYLDSYDDRSLIEYFFPYLETTVFFCFFVYNRLDPSDVGCRSFGK